MFLSLSHVVSWVRCGTSLYRFLTFVTFVTLNDFFRLLVRSFPHGAVDWSVAFAWIVAFPGLTLLYHLVHSIISPKLVLLTPSSLAVTFLDVSEQLRPRSRTTKCRS